MGRLSRKTEHRQREPLVTLCVSRLPLGWHISARWRARNGERGRQHGEMARWAILYRTRLGGVTILGDCATAALAGRCGPEFRGFHGHTQ